MGVTTDLSIPYPDLGDPANGPAAFQSGLQLVDDYISDTTLSTYTPLWTSSGGSAPSAPASLVGTYRLDHGVCRFHVRLICNASTVGGTGNLVLTAPLPVVTILADQNVMAELATTASGGGIYLGFAKLNQANGAAMQIFFPASSADNRMNRWRNAAVGNAAGTGFPNVPAGYAIVDLAEINIAGTYFV